MTTEELIKELQAFLEEHGDLEVIARGSSNGTFANCDQVRAGLSPSTEGFCCVTTDR